MKVDNIHLGNEIFYDVRDLKEIKLIELVYHLSEEDVLETLSHLNSMFMTVIVNPESTISHHSNNLQKKILDNIHNVNHQLKTITSNIRHSPQSYWRGVRLNYLVEN